MLRTKKSLLRQTAFSCCLSALLGGISEPTTYGICYKMVRPYYAYLITALSTAVLAGLLHLKCYAFGGYSLTNILLYLGPNLDYANFRNALLLVGFMLIMSFITVNLIGFDDSCYSGNCRCRTGCRGISLLLPSFQKGRCSMRLYDKALVAEIDANQFTKEVDGIPVLFQTGAGCGACPSGSPPAGDHHQKAHHVCQPRQGRLDPFQRALPPGTT